ncbi:hypothetical protein PQBR44_0100 (plasmid) [Pseudomonas putida UWC1]|nr:hypothetical protein PQBR44_0100 [Pseudomonas putida UWC1]
MKTPSLTAGCDLCRLGEAPSKKGNAIITNKSRCDLDA